MAQQHANTVGPPSATHLLAEGADISDDYRADTGTCCFCASERPGIDADEAVSEQYFSDDDMLDAPGSQHVCDACAWAMNQRTFKQGHWIAHADGVETPSTGDLLGVFRQIRNGQFNPPLAIYVTSSPIRSSHSYLWTPVNDSDQSVTVSYDRQQVRIENWDKFARLVGAVEDCRLCGFTFDELRSGEPRVQNVREMGTRVYSLRDVLINPHRRTARLELALTLSRSADDQPRTNLTEQHDPLT